MYRILIAATAATLFSLSAHAETDCSFTPVGNVWNMDGNCSTDTTIFVPQGITLDGNGFRIYAFDPPGGHFRGAVIQNAGGRANVQNLMVYTLPGGFNDVCDGPTPLVPEPNPCDPAELDDGRLRGIMLLCASGDLVNNRVFRMNQGESACNEGNGIEARNPVGAPRKQVRILDNLVDGYQKTGILVIGHVTATVNNNRLYGQGTIEHIAQNGIEFSDGASGMIVQNKVLDNHYTGNDFAAAGILIQSTETVQVRNNALGDNEIGLWILDVSGVVARQNRIVRSISGAIVIDDQLGAIDLVRVLENTLIGGVTGVGVFGINATGTRIEENRIKNFETGIFVGYEASGTDIRANEVWFNRADGIVVEASDNIVSNNDVYRSAGVGLIYTGDNGTISDNSVRRASGDVGILITGAHNQVSRNDSFSNSAPLDISNEGMNNYLGNVCDTSSGPPVDCGDVPEMP